LIPVGDSDFSFVPRSRHVEYSIFTISSPSLKIHHLSLFIILFMVVSIKENYIRIG